MCTFLCKWLCHHFGWMLKITRKHKLLPRIEEHKSYFFCLCHCYFFTQSVFWCVTFSSKKSKTFYKSIMSLQKATWPLMRNDTYNENKEEKKWNFRSTLRDLRPLCRYEGGENKGSTQTSHKYLQLLKHYDNRIKEKSLFNHVWLDDPTSAAHGNTKWHLGSYSLWRCRLSSSM